MTVISSMEDEITQPIPIGDRAKPKLVRRALEFVSRSEKTKPRIFTGHKVANDDSEARITNFSTITAIVEVDEQRFFLIYRYPLSWVHSLTDNLQRWANGRPSWKPFRRETWESAFERKSRIRPVITFGAAPGLVALPYIPNWNLHDVLAHGVGGFSRADICDLLFAVMRRIDALHEENKAWGELIVNNVIIDKRTFEPRICGTEAQYFPFVSLQRRQMHDWRDFIFSACGAASRGNSTREQQIDIADLAQRLTNGIGSAHVRNMLIEYCGRRYLCGHRSLLQVMCWQGLGGSLSCSWQDYNRIREAIANA